MNELRVPFSEAMTAHAVEGEVVVLGPDSVAVALTPEAAEESARRLTTAAAEARRQPANSD
ncbi:hypothetical protein LRS10_11645 [Phenylobacterium sp. J426]|uniref:hypothetical protein n=1 Tax=Phenylobacterium sp. J426 TaxID=2898439 RepID=UPI00215114BB|nr:hypothetical protein [Phenylobacterium sp. J426]MCR5874762.1 hypothetical protein [Phenylobacterium sp. J426]